MPDKGITRLIRFLAIYTIVGGAATLLAPESMGKLSRWFADNRRYLRLIGIVDIGLGLWLIQQQHQAEAPPRPWWKKLFGR
jgi:hypothetical protein